MSKFSNILNFNLKLSVCCLFVFGCAGSETQKETDIKKPSQFEVNKETNSFKKIDTSKLDEQFKEKNTPKKSVKKKPLFDWPVWEARMSRGFMPKGTKRRKRPHKGIDLAAPRGLPVLSSHDGVVIYTGKDFNGFGKMIMIETVGEDIGYATLYAHLDKIVVYDGQKISQGDVIGALGNTGRSSGPHLHFEIRRSDGIPIDPLPLLPAGKDLTNDVDDPSAPEE